MSKQTEKLWSRKGSKPERNRKIAKKVLRWRDRNPVDDLAEKYGVSRVRIYQIVKKYEEDQKD
jgi:Mor family transcriptional regulator